MKNIKKMTADEIYCCLQTYLERFVKEGGLTAVENNNFLLLYKEYIFRQSFTEDCDISFQVNKKLADYAVVDKVGKAYTISIDKRLFNCCEVSDLAKALIFAGHTIQYAFQMAEKDKLAEINNKKTKRMRLVLGKTKTKFVTVDNRHVLNFVERFNENSVHEEFVDNQPWDIAPEYAKEIIYIVERLTKNEEVKEYLFELTKAIKQVAYIEYCLAYKVKQNITEDKKRANKIEDAVPYFGA